MQGFCIVGALRGCARVASETGTKSRFGGESREMGRQESEEIELRNLTMLTDFYQLTMMNGYFKTGSYQNEAVFDLFFRKQGEETNYAVCAGLEQAIEYVNNLHFEPEDIAYLRSLNVFDSAFLDYLQDLRFTGDIDALPEGTIVFPMEPIMRVRAPICEAQLVETALLTIINHQTLIATKASRIVHAAQGDSVLEFGLRRAQGPDAGLYGGRAAMIAGCNATSDVLAAQMFGVKAAGTHAHSWVMSFEDEITAFRAYADTFPQNCLLLVDTYDTLKSGVPNAIQVFRELREKGYEAAGIRLDSGDLAYLSKEARKMMDDAGFPNAKIVASSDLDEYVIADLKQQGARIDTWGVGTRLITGGYESPALGGVYKLSAVIEGERVIPKLKISSNIAKITNPGIKKVVRIYGKTSGKAIADLIMLEQETIDETRPLTIFDPVETWKKMTITDFTIKELLVPVFRRGEQVYACPDMETICASTKAEKDTFWDEFKRLKRPHIYKVDLSDGLYALKTELLNQKRG